MDKETAGPRPLTSRLERVYVYETTEQHERTTVWIYALWNAKGGLRQVHITSTRLDWNEMLEQRLSKHPRGGELDRVIAEVVLPIVAPARLVAHHNLLAMQSGVTTAVTVKEVLSISGSDGVAADLEYEFTEWGKGGGVKLESYPWPEDAARQLVVRNETDFKCCLTCANLMNKQYGADDARFFGFCGRQLNEQNPKRLDPENTSGVIPGVDGFHYCPAWRRAGLGGPD